MERGDMEKTHLFSAEGEEVAQELLNKSPIEVYKTATSVACVEPQHLGCLVYPSLVSSSYPFVDA